MVVTVSCVYSFDGDVHDPLVRGCWVGRPSSDCVVSVVKDVVVSRVSVVKDVVVLVISVVIDVVLLLVSVVKDVVSVVSVAKDVVVSIVSDVKDVVLSGTFETVVDKVSTPVEEGVLVELL